MGHVIEMMGVGRWFPRSKKIEMRTRCESGEVRHIFLQILSFLGRAARESAFRALLCQDLGKSVMDPRVAGNLGVSKNA